MNANRNTVSRALHDLGAAAWFGGSLMGAVAINGASRDVSDASERTMIASDAWGRWSPVAAAAIAAHTIGGIGLLIAGRDRITRQSGVTGNTVVKTVLTGAALATTAYSGVLGAQLAHAEPEHATSGTIPDERTPRHVARIQQELRVLQWVTPVLTGLLVVLGAQQGEQQQPAQVRTGRISGRLRR